MQQDSADAIQCGNHKSAHSNSAILFNILSSEVKKGWQLPLPIDKLGKIPAPAVISPMGPANQISIDEEGNQMPKWQLTHDQSFSFTSGLSVNDRAIDSSLSICRCSFTLPRVCHCIVSLRVKFPLVPILLSKFDFKSARHRMHFHADTAFQSTITMKGLNDDPVTLTSLCATFGGHPCTFLWSEISEPTCNLASTIVQCPEWDPDELCSPH